MSDVSDRLLDLERRMALLERRSALLEIRSRVTRSAICRRVLCMLRRCDAGSRGIMTANGLDLRETARVLNQLQQAKFIHLTHVDAAGAHGRISDDGICAIDEDLP